VLLAVTGRALPLQRWLGVFSLAWPAVYLVVRATEGPLNDVEIVAGVALLLAVACWKWEPAPGLLRWLAPIGAISYAIYALGSPLQAGVRLYLPTNGLLASAGVRVVLLTGVTFGLAWLLERRLQPWLKRRCAGRG